MMFRVRVFAIAVALSAGLACSLTAKPVRADSGLLVGVSDDIFKSEPNLSSSFAHDLGLGAARVSLTWTPGRSSVHPSDVVALEDAVSTGVRVVVSVYGSPRDVPLDELGRDAYCSYVRNVIERVPQIKDVVIWNEPNLSLFWQPQFAADGSSLSAAAYEALLAHCWDLLHAARPDVNVIAPALCPWGSDSPVGPLTISHSAVMFIRRLGEAYRASGRTKPIFDTVGHHVYGESPGERPWRQHTFSRRISQGDLGKLVRELQDAFAGTSQPVPGVPAGARAAGIWYLEAGFESIPDPAKQSLYVNREREAAVPASLGAPPWSVLPDPASRAPDQATQLRDALTLAYCQPYVTAFFNFLLRDQEDLTFWQSGLLWADRTPKASYTVFRDTLRAIATRAVDCSPFSSAAFDVLSPTTSAAAAGGAALIAEPSAVPDPQHVGTTAAGPGPRRPRPSLTLRWVRSPSKAYRRHAAVRLAVRANERARYVAALVDLRGRQRLVKRGLLASGSTTPIHFARLRLHEGRYRAVIRVPDRPAATLRSRPFLVLRAVPGR